MKGGRGNKASDNSNSFSGGTSITYTYRLLRDRPDLADQVKSGAMSANKAAIEAGFRKKPTPFEQVQNLLPKLDSRRRRWRADPPVAIPLLPPAPQSVHVLAWLDGEHQDNPILANGRALAALD